MSSYAPGWLGDYSTVASALRENYAALGPFDASDVVIGMSYLRSEERRARAEAARSTAGAPPDPHVLGRGPSKAEVDDLRALCVAAEASYSTDRDALADALKSIGHDLISTTHVELSASKFQQPAHFISQRLDAGEIFLVIRGTASAKDALTDGDCAVAPLDSSLPELRGADAHRGMARAAQWVFTQSEPLLRNALGAVSAASKKKTFSPKLVLIGHSLGAGVAAILATKFRALPGFGAFVRCAAFACPPCLDERAGDACEPYVTSVVLHDDVVCRASLQNVQGLVRRIDAIDWRAMAREDFDASDAGRAAAFCGRGLESVRAGAGAAAKIAADGAAKAAKAAGAALDAALGKGAGAKAKEAREFAAKTAVATAARAKDAAGAALSGAFKRGLSGFSGSSSKNNEAPEEGVDEAGANTSSSSSSSPSLMHVPGRVFHIHRGVLGAGASAARVSRRAATLAKVELSSSLLADHSLVEYREALDTLAIGAAAGPSVEVRGALEVLELDLGVDARLKGAALAAAAGAGLAVGVFSGFAIGAAALASRGRAREALFEDKGTRWVRYEDCFVLAHETCVKRANEREGETYPTKLELFGKSGGAGAAATRANEVEVVGEVGGIRELRVVAVGGGGAEGGKVEARFRVPEGGDEAFERWRRALERCCRGERGEPKPGAPKTIA